jgi:hypothetical protein
MLLASALTVLASITTAQITITNATFPAAGDSLVFAVDENPVGLNPATPPGGPQTWDFSALDKDEVFSTVYRDASTGNNFFRFPGADLVVINQAGETYFNVTNNQFEVLGFSGSDPANLGLQIDAAKFVPALIERRAPLNFFDINSPSTSLRLTFPTNVPPLDSIFGQFPVNIDSMRVRINTNRLEVVDGWGAALIPGASYPVLRQKRTEYTTTSIDVYVVLFPGFGNWVDLSTIIGGGGGGGGIGNFLGTDTTVTYRFYNDIEKEEIAVATMSNDLSTVETVRYKNLSSSSTKTPVNLISGGIQAFPNPAVEWVRFDCTDLVPGEYTLKLFNIIGKCVWKKNYTLAGTTSFRVDLEDFKKGTYIYSLVDKDGNSVGTKRLVVLKP